MSIRIVSEITCIKPGEVVQGPCLGYSPGLYPPGAYMSRPLATNYPEELIVTKEDADKMIHELSKYFTHKKDQNAIDGIGNNHLCIDSMTNISYMNTTSLSKITQASFFAIGSDPTRHLFIQTDYTSATAELNASMAKRVKLDFNTIYGGTSHYYELDVGAAKRLIPINERDIMKDRENMINMILDNIEKYKPKGKYWRHVHNFGYKFNTDKCVVLLTRRPVIQKRCDVDSFIFDFVKSLEIGCKLCGLELVSSHEELIMTSVVQVHGVAKDNNGKYGWIKLSFNKLKALVLYDGDLEVNKNINNLSMDKWGLYGRAYFDMEGFDALSQIFVPDGIGYTIKYTIPEFDFRPAYETSLLIPYGQLYKGANYTDIQSKDIFDKNPSIKHIRKIKK